MPYPPERREQVKERIVQSARSLFNRHGFIAVSIDDVMASAGLTRGSFYSYFESKSELYAEIIDRFVGERRADVSFVVQSKHRAVRILHDHLGKPEKTETDCPLLKLYGDLSRVDGQVSAAFETALKLMIDTFEHGVTPTTPGSPRQRAMALVSLCVGGKILDDWIQDRALARELKEAALFVALTLL
jgi:TetR/AcrR family transcriptional repressor of nem operon